MVHARDHYQHAESMLARVNEVIQADTRHFEVRDFPIVSNEARVCCSRPPCHESCLPQTLGEAIDWALNHECEASAPAGDLGAFITYLLWAAQVHAELAHADAQSGQTLGGGS